MYGHPEVWQVYGDDPADVIEGAIQALDGYLGLDPAVARAPWALEAADGLRDSAGSPGQGLIGMVGLLPTSFDPPFAHRADPCVEIGWRLHHRWWGQGLVTEAAAHCLDHARTVLGLPEVVAFASRDNDRSRAVMVRLGMMPDLDGDFDHPRMAEGDPRRPHVLFRTAW